MKKFNYYLAAFVFAASMSASLTSCIDTDEPEGIAALRTAKAGYINAETSLKKAEVAQQEAETALQLIENQIKEVDLAKANLELALAEVKNEKDIYDAQLSLEEAKIKAQQTIDDAKYAVEAALKANAIKRANLENTLTNPLYAATGTTLKTAYDNYVAAEAAYMGSYDPSTGTFTDGTIQKLADKEEAYVNAVAKSTDSITTGRSLDNALTLAKLSVDSKKTAKAKFEALAQSKDVEDWINQYAELDKLIDDLAYQENNLNIEKQKLTNEETTLNAEKTAVEAEYDAKKTELDNPTTEYNAIESYYKFEYDNEALYNKMKGNSNFTTNFKVTSKYLVSNEEIKNENISTKFADAISELKTYASEQKYQENQAAYKSLDLKTLKEAMEADQKEWQGFMAELAKAQNSTDVAAAQSKFTPNFLGDASRYAVPNTEELEALTDAELAGYGSWGAYQLALRSNKSLSEDISAYSAAKSLLAEMQAVVDAYDARIAELDNEKAEQLAGLQSYVDEIADLTQKISDKGIEITDKTAEITAVSTPKGEYEALQTTIKGFAKLAGKKYNESTKAWEGEDIAFDDAAFEEKVAISLAGYDYDIRKANDDVTIAEQNKNNFKAGIYDAETEIAKAAAELEQAQENNEYAKAYYEEMKAEFDTVYEATTSAFAQE